MAVILISTAVTVFVGVLVLAHSSGRLPLITAIVLLLAPLGIIAIALRPSWLILFMAAVPPGILSFVPTRGLMFLALVTLAGIVVTRGKVYLDIRSGMLPIASLIAISFFYRSELSGQDALVARGYLNSLAFWMLLALITYNMVRFEELDIRKLIVALGIGAGATILLAKSGATTASFADQEGLAGIGERAPHAAFIGFSITSAWLIHVRQRARLETKALLTITATVFLIMVATSFFRVLWLSGLVFVFLLAVWTRRSRYWLVIPIVFALFLMVPTVQDEVLPKTAAGYDITVISTGRTELWGILWREEVLPTLPFGNGYGHTFTLRPDDIFGFQTFQVAGTSNLFVFPHNDFIFWMMELGLVGLGALLIFWWYLVRVARRLASSGDTDYRAMAFILSGIIVLSLVVHLVDNAFAIPAVAVPFYISAGFLFGLGARLHEEKSRPSYP
jgi:hypothetical protein